MMMKKKFNFLSSSSKIPKVLRTTKLNPRSLRQRIFVWCKNKISNELAHGNKLSRVALQRGGERRREKRDGSLRNHWPGKNLKYTKFGWRKFLSARLIPARWLFSLSLSIAIASASCTLISNEKRRRRRMERAGPESLFIHNRHVQSTRSCRVLFAGQGNGAPGKKKKEKSQKF